MKNIIKKTIAILVLFVLLVSCFMPTILANDEISREEILQVKENTDNQIVEDVNESRIDNDKEEVKNEKLYQEKPKEDEIETYSEENNTNNTECNAQNIDINNMESEKEIQSNNEIDNIKEKTEKQNSDIPEQNNENVKTNESLKNDDKNQEEKEQRESNTDDQEQQENDIDIPEEQEPVLTYSTHVQNIGWQNYVKNSEIAGTEGKALRLEALKINIETQLEGTIQYSTHIQNIGWQKYVTNEEISGTTGRSYRLEALKVKLTGELSEKYDIYYRTHIQNLGWLAWAKNGEEAGTQNYAYRMEAIQIKLVKKGTEVEIKGKAFLVKPVLNYQTHVQNIGWQGYVNNGDISGTQGRSLRLEGIKIKLGNMNVSGSVQYSTHVQDIGWQNFVGENQLAGTTGKSLRLEGIKIKLTGEIKKSFDIYYRTHVENMGWLAWAKNGEEAGTEGYAYRLEAIQIKIVPKNEPAPGNTVGHFYNKALERKSIEGIKLVFGNLCAGVDVSEHNKTINWQAVKNIADFAVVRCGYGQNIDSQDDKKFEANIQECIQNNIPIEVYLYSYADTVEKADSEAEHVLRLCNKYKKYIKRIWYDVEDNSVFNQVISGGISKDTLGQIIDRFSGKLTSNGYKVGLYTYSKALENYFPSNVKNKYKIWIANYPGNSKDAFETTYNAFKKIYEMWQFTSSGIINGIITNVDLNIRF